MAQDKKKNAALDTTNPLAAMMKKNQSEKLSSKTAGQTPPPLPKLAGTGAKKAADTKPPTKETGSGKVKKAPPPILKPSGKQKSAASTQASTPTPPAPKAPAISKTTGPVSIASPMSSLKATGSAAAKLELSEPAPEELARGEEKVDKKPSQQTTADGADQENDVDRDGRRRVSRRRPAGPVRGRVAANDDAPSIGGLIYALDQKPSNKPFRYASIASALWSVAGLAFTWVILASRTTPEIGFTSVLQQPITFLVLTAVIVPIAVIWFLALLAWRSEELRLRSSTMTEVAIRLAEPDRMAEQSVATLGQAVRRQVSFMNDAVSQAIGRASELEAMVHNEVSELENAYEENERKIRNLIQELSGERHALLNTSERVTTTLQELGSDVPHLIEKLSSQQIKLAQIIQGAGENLTSLEGALSVSADKLETSLGTRTEALQTVLTDHAEALDTTLGDRTENMQGMLEQYTGALGGALGKRTDEMQGMLEDYTGALAEALGARSEQIQKAFEKSMDTIDTSMSTRTDNLQAVFEEYARALDSALSNRADSLDSKLIERTKALDEAFNSRLELFDNSIQKSTSAIDSAVSERAAALTSALEQHAKTFKTTITLQANDLDESINHGVNAVRRSSENITRQSLKAIEGLAGQSEMLRNVSENLLGQINTVTNRFETQGQSIMKAANSLETANYKIDTTLQNRHSEIASTLDRLSGKADEFGSFMSGYSNSIEGSISEAETRARAVAEELRDGAVSQHKATLESLNQLRSESAAESDRALAELRQRFATVSNEVATHIGSLSTRLDETSEDVRQRAATAAQDIANEQARLKAQLDQIPVATRENTEAMRLALEDQLRALDQLSQLTAREAGNRDVRMAPNPPAPASALKPASPALAGAPAPTPEPAPATQPKRVLSSLSSTINEQIKTRTSPPAAAAPTPGHQPAHQSTAKASGSGWSLGDLLQRASLGDDGRDTATGNGFDVDVIAQALDAATAAAIWARVRTGQRGVMVRSLYSMDGRVAFDDLASRLQSDVNLQQAVRQYITDFERIIAVAEQQDSSGRTTEQHMMAETGRVYLFLAHAAGRIV
ncbi:MAG: hypothetical protein ACRBCJ_01240 [Hyphomicrobiaceae bacterium]